MLLRLFKSNLPYVIFLIPLVAFVMWLPVFFPTLSPHSISNPQISTPIFDAFLAFMGKQPLVQHLVALLVFVLQAYIIVRLNFKYIFLDTKTYLPAVLFVMFTSVFIFYQGFQPASIAGLFFLLALDKVLLIDKEKNQLKRYFEGGLFLGIGSLFYTQSILFLGVLWLSLFTLRSFNWREWIVSIFGTLFPLAMLISITWFYNIHQPYLEFAQSIISHTQATPNFSFVQIAAYGFTAFIAFVSLLHIVRFVGIKKISTRKYFSFFFTSILYVFIVIFTVPQVGFESIYFVTFPLAVMVSIYLMELRKNWVSETVFALLLLAILTAMYL